LRFCLHSSRTSTWISFCNRSMNPRHVEAALAFFTL
jgi:hypothetical protein